MLTKTINAEVFIEELSTSGSYPSKVECSDGHMYIVKHSQQNRNYLHLINEFIGSHLAKLANINIPDFALIRLIDEVFPPTYHYQLGKPNGLGFGSQFLSNTSKNLVVFHKSNFTKLTGITLHDISKDLIDICVYDTWVMNSDRSVNNTNLLLHESSSNIKLVAIDQASIFYGLSYKLLVKEKTENLSVGDTLVYSDLFSSIYEKVGIFFEVYKNIALDNIKSISDNKIKDVVDSVPNDWHITSSDKNNIIGFLIYRKNSIEKFFNNVLTNAGF